MLIQRNVISSGCGSGVSLIEGMSNSTVTNNYIFNNEKQGIVLFNYLDGQTSILPFDETRNTISNNVIWAGKDEPTWCKDGGNQAALFEAILWRNAVDPKVWRASQAHLSGDWVKPTLANGRIYQALANGTSGTTEPTWQTTIGNKTTDGKISWQNAVIPTLDNNTITGNQIVTYNGPAFKFYENAYWNTTIISNDTIYKTTTNRNYTNVFLTINAVNYNWSQFQEKSSTFIGNTNADPGFVAASITYQDTPNSFNFNIIKGVRKK